MKRGRKHLLKINDALKRGHKQLLRATQTGQIHACVTHIPAMQIRSRLNAHVRDQLI